MIGFVNAKINIGLQVTGRRADGYHELGTVFFPVGVHAGTPLNPERFCDMLEIVPRRPEEGQRFAFRQYGRILDCPQERNLAYRAAESYFASLATPGFGATIDLEKVLPDGAGMGGGSADASFTLRMLSDLDSMLNGERDDFIPRDADTLARMALRLGADCPVFIYNRPMYAEGVGERLEDIDLDLSGFWLVAVKPRLSISTREAFAGITPRKGNFDLRKLPDLPLSEWRAHVRNDFEESLFPRYPELSRLKERLYGNGAAYASMTGSGSALYGIYGDKETARASCHDFRKSSTIEGAWLLKL